MVNLNPKELYDEVGAEKYDELTELGREVEGVLDTTVELRLPYMIELEPKAYDHPNWGEIDHDEFYAYKRQSVRAFTLMLPEMSKPTSWGDGVVFSDDTTVFWRASWADTEIWVFDTFDAFERRIGTTFLDQAELVWLDEAP